MATFKICVFEHQKRKDGKYPVSIRVWWKGKGAFISTEYYVSDKQIRQSTIKLEGGKVKRVFELKDVFILNELNSRIASYEDLKAKKLGLNIELYSAKQLAEYFKKETTPGSVNINFVEFSSKHIQGLKTKGKNKTAQSMQTALNALVDYCNGRSPGVNEITVKFLEGFEGYLRKERTIKRLNQFGKEVTIERKGCSNTTIHDYLKEIRTLFNQAMDEFNDYDRGDIRIAHYPFKKYNLPDPDEPKMRNLDVDIIRLIRDATDERLKNKRALLARDVFMLSFYLAGINLKDLYYLCPDNYKKGRLSYERSKTKTRRKDRAFISMQVVPEALPLFEKYKDKSGEFLFDFHARYADHETFVSNIDKGLKHCAKVLNIDKPVSSYYARFSFASIASNDCGVSLENVGITLNHEVEKKMKTTKGYIAKDWSKVDNTIRAVIDHLNMVPLPVSNQSADTP
jgi:site-specific recombinase XerD